MRTRPPEGGSWPNFVLIDAALSSPATAAESPNMRGMVTSPMNHPRTIIIAALLAAILPTLIFAAPGRMVSLVNYLDKPLPQSAIAVDASALYKELNIAPGTPLSAGEVPVFLSGDKVVFYAHLDASERKVLAVERAVEWRKAAEVSRADAATIANGVISVRFENRSFHLNFTNGSILERVRWDGGISYDRHATRDTWEGLPALGAAAQLRTRTLADGGAEMVVEEVLPVLGDTHLRVKHRLVLYPHQPIAEYRVTLTNPGPKMYFLSTSAVHGDYGALLKGELELQEPAGSADVEVRGMDFAEARFTRLPLWKEWAQRPRRWGHVPNCAVVSSSGYAVGFSSLDNYGPIWMNAERWIYRPSSFLLRAIAMGSHFPIELRPGQSIEVGNIFYGFTPDNMAFGETVRAFQQVRDGEAPAILASAAVLVGDTPVKRQFIRRTELTVLEEQTLALRVNLEDKPILKLGFAPGAGIGKVRVLEADSQLRGRAAALGADVGEYRLSDLLQGSGMRDLTLRVTEPGTLASLVLAPASASAPELEMPVEGMELTDLASSFKWKAVPGFGQYELQVANDSDFREVTLHDSVSLGDVAYGYYQCLDLLETGKHYWRVRAVGGDWSKVGSFMVNDAYSIREPMLEPPAGEPLYTFFMRPVEPYVAKYGRNPIPEELRRNSTLITYLTTVGSPDKGQSIRKDTQQTASLNVGVAYRTLCMADAEWAFQNLPNVTGFVDGENLGSLLSMDNDSTTPNRLTRRQFLRYVQLSAKYGRYVIFGDGELRSYAKIGIDEEWRQMMARYGRHVRLGFKTNITDFMHAAADANMGLYLTGVFINFHYETEKWYWDHAGFRELGTQFGFREGNVEMHPPMFANLQMLAGLARGANSFKSEALAGRWNITNDPVTSRIILPFLRALITHKLVPSREELMENIKVAVVLPDDAAKAPLRGGWGPYQALYEATYGLPPYSEYNQNWPDNSRYYFIPLLPIGTKVVPGIERIVALEELTSVEKVKEVFDPFYPPIKGDAFRAVLGDKIFIMPGRENEDRVYTYEIPLKGGRIQGLDGNIGPMQYLIGKRYRDGDEIWLQSDAAITHWKGTGQGEKLEPKHEFPDATFALHCDARPELEVLPAEALKSASWADGRLTLTVSHEHGAVQIRAFVP